MGAVSDLIYDVRNDIKKHCPPETLHQYDRCLTQIGTWEDEMWDTYSINPISRKFWQRPYTVFGALSWFLAGAITTAILAVAIVIPFI